MIAQRKSKFGRSKINRFCRTIEETFPREPSFLGLARKVDDADRAWFAGALSMSAIQHGFSWLLSPEPPSSIKPILTVDEVLCSPEVLGAPAAIEVVLTQMQITPQQSILVEESTRGQHKNPLWSSYRKGRLTSSKFGLVLKPILANRAVCNSTMKRLLGKDNLSSVRSVQWGIQHEATAIKAYTEHTGLTVFPSGLWLHSSGIIGGSPDGVVSSEKIIEVKCPFSGRDKHLLELVDTDSNCFLKRTGNTNLLELNMSSVCGFNYYHQVQGNLHLTDRKVCDLVVWCPKSMYVIPIYKDESWPNNIPILFNFFKTIYMPKYMQGGVDE